MMKEIVKTKERVAFVGRISKMGERKIVYIPKEVENVGLPNTKYVKVRLEGVMSE